MFQIQMENGTYIDIYKDLFGTFLIYLLHNKAEIKSLRYLSDRQIDRYYLI